MTHHGESELKIAAHDVIHEYRNGKLPDIPGSWEQTWVSLCAELQRRCPGFTKQQDLGFSGGSV